jgi:putative transposase
MAIPKRHANVPGTYFVTSRTWESRRLFVTERVCNLFVDALLHYRDEGHFTLHAFVLMPDHFHALITLSAEISLERAVRFIKGGSARIIGKELNFRFPIWQRGFSDHRIRDERDYAAHVQYIHLNPVKKGLVMWPEEYIWSSASGKYRADQRPSGHGPPWHGFNHAASAR